MKVRTIWFELNVLYVAALAISLSLYSGLLYFNLYHSLYSELDQDLQKKSFHINNMLGSYLNILGRDPKSFIFSAQQIVGKKGRHPHSNKVERFEELWSKQGRVLGLSKDYVNILNARGESIVRSGPFDDLSYPSLSKDIQASLRGKGAVVTKDIELGKKRLRVITRPIPFELKEPHVLQVGVSLAETDAILKQRQFFIIFSVLVLLISTSLLNQFFSARILKPVLEIAMMARHLNYQDLSKRITSRYPDEEMQNLVDSFNDMLSRLERSFKYITQFSAHVSHELKTPLAIMKGESELALRKAQEPAEYSRVIQNNLEEIDRMVRIVNDLLLLTRLDYQPEVFKLEDMDLVDFFKEMEGPANVLAQDKNISILFHLPTKSLIVKGDRVHLRRLFFNLIHNAIKFTPSGGRIDVTLKAEKGNASILVADTGVGIPPQILPKIFDQFFHFDRPGPGQPVGTGLGLSIAKSIANIHRGKIDVQSHPGKGSIFTVELPI